MARQLARINRGEYIAAGMSARLEFGSTWILDDDGGRIVMRHPPEWLRRRQATLMLSATVLFFLLIAFMFVAFVVHETRTFWLIGLGAILEVVGVVGIARNQEERFTFDVRRQLLFVDDEKGGTYVSEIRLVPRSEHFYSSSEIGDRHWDWLGLRAADRLLWESTDISAVEHLASVLSERLGVPRVTS